MKKQLLKLYESRGQGIYENSFFSKRFDELLEYYGAEKQIPIRHLIGIWKNPVKYNFVFENLKSHDWRKLGNQLQRLFPENFKSIDSFFTNFSNEQERKEFCRIYFKGTKEKSLEKLMKDLKQGFDFNDTSLDSWNKLSSILNFFNYSVSDILPWGIVNIEPLYPTSGKHYINEVCHGIVYHMTSKEDVKSILKSGLRCRNGNRDFKYRFFPKRVYVFAIDPQKYNPVRRIKEIALDRFGRSINEISILKCKVNGDLFYRDAAMEEEAYFTYHTIPPENITVLKP